MLKRIGHESTKKRSLLAKQIIVVSESMEHLQFYENALPHISSNL